MDNQKSNDGNARNVGSEGSGSSMGKDLGAGRSGDNKGSNDANKGSDIIGKAADIGKNAADSAAKSATDLHKTIDKAADSAQPVVDRLASSAHAGVDKVTNALSGVTTGMDDKARQLTEAYKNFAETGRDYVRTSPATSVLVALAAGYTLSKILGRRH